MDEPSDEVPGPVPWAAVQTEGMPMPKAKPDISGATARTADKASEKTPMKFLQWMVAVVLLSIIGFTGAKAVRDDMKDTEQRRFERERDMHNRVEMETTRQTIDRMRLDLGAKLDRLIELQSKRDAAP